MAESATAASPSAKVVELTRLLSGTPEEVFAAWTDPESMSTWMKPGPASENARVTADVRVGGKYQIDMISKNDCYEHTGEYLVVDPPCKLVFTWISKGTNGERSVVTVALHPRGDKTELVLTHEDLPEAQREGHRKGWTEIFDQLERTFEK